MVLQSLRKTEKNGTGHAPAGGPASMLGQAEPLVASESLEADFQRIKTGIHRELLDSLDLSKIAGQPGKVSQRGCLQHWIAQFAGERKTLLEERLRPTEVSSRHILGDSQPE